jgi:hypothetical protein
MTNLEQLKQDLANLTERVNCAMALTDGSIYLTRDQLKDLINTITQQTMEHFENELKDIDLDIEDYINLDLDYNRTIQVDFDNGSYFRDIKSNLTEPDEITDEDIDAIVEKYK